MAVGPIDPTDHISFIRRCQTVWKNAPSSAGTYDLCYFIYTLPFSYSLINSLKSPSLTHPTHPLTQLTHSLNSHTQLTHSPSQSLTLALTMHVFIHPIWLLIFIYGHLWSVAVVCGRLWSTMIFVGCWWSLMIADNCYWASMIFDHWYSLIVIREHWWWLMINDYHWYPLMTAWHTLDLWWSFMIINDQCSFTQSLKRSHISLTHSFRQSLISLTHTPTSLTHSLHLLFHFTYSLIHSFTNSLIHSPTPSLTLSLIFTHIFRIGSVFGFTYLCWTYLVMYILLFIGFWNQTR